MGMFKLTCLVVVTVIIMVSTTAVYAKVAGPVEAEHVCQNWLSFMVYQKGEWAGAANPEIAGITEIKDGDTVLARCYLISPSGFIVVPVLKELPPVKAYSQDSWLDVNETEGLAALIKDVLLHRIRLFVKFYGSLDAVQPSTGDVLFGREHGEQWERFAVDPDEFTATLEREDRSPFESYGPLLTTSWHQHSPYNNLCPMGDGGRCLAGCVATAAAQIMAYWQYPPEGTGNHTYWWYGDRSCNGTTPGQYLTADFSDPYDWENMPDDCHSGCTQDEENAVAELCYEVGVAFEMDYGYCGSGAWTWYATTVFPTYFRYDESIAREDREDYPTAEEWSNIIKDEITADRPIQYRIKSHSIVCDGWRNTGGMNQYHMNYGWDDSHNAWYTIDNLYCPWPGCGPLEEYAIVHILPVDTDDDEIPDIWDNCVYTYNPLQEDYDTDSLGDSCDNCIYAYNPVQEDSDANGVGDSCDYNCANPTAWERTYGWGLTDGARSIQQTYDGGYVIAGVTNSFFPHDFNVLLVKTNTCGNIVWFRTYDGGGNGYAWCVQQTSDSGFVIAGSNNGYFYLLRTDATGDSLWAKTYGGCCYYSARSVQQTSDSGFIVAGQAATDVFSDIDFFVLKADSIGDTLWTRRYGQQDQDVAYSIDQTSDFGYIIAGRMGAAAYLVKTDSAGGTLWTKTLVANAIAYSVGQTADGGYIIAGTIDGNFSVIKTDEYGEIVWTKAHGDPNSGEAYSIEQTSDFGYIIAGYVGHLGCDAHFYVVRADFEGDTLWTVTYDNCYGSDEVAFCIQQTSDGGYVAAGHSNCFLSDYAYDFYVVKIEPDSLMSCCNHDGKRGDANYDNKLNVSDMTYLVNYLFKGGPPPPCEEEGNVDGLGGINVADLNYLVAYLFQGGDPPVPCP